MTRRMAMIAASGVLGALAWAAIANAAVNDVRMGNFYFEDGSVGDGQIVITAGDQIRFIVEDSGPGTPHTIDIDAFGVHSGNLAKGETFTTGPLTAPGTYALYCSLHIQRGHQTTLIILEAPGSPTTTASPTTTTTLAATTTTTTATATTTAAPTTSAPVVSETGDTSTTPSDDSDVVPPDETTTLDDTESSTETAAAENTTNEGEGDAARIVSGTEMSADQSTDGSSVLAPTGRGEIALDALPPDPDSLTAILGRPPATDSPWTRAVRQSLFALIPLTLIVGAALLRHQRTQKSQVN